MYRDMSLTQGQKVQIMVQMVAALASSPKIELLHPKYSIFTQNIASSPKIEGQRPRGVGINCLVALQREAWHNEI